MPTVASGQNKADSPKVETQRTRLTMSNSKAIIPNIGICLEKVFNLHGVNEEQRNE